VIGLDQGVMGSKIFFPCFFSIFFSNINFAASSLSPQRLRTRGDSAWQHALDAKSASEAASATREANKFYYEAYNASSDPLFAASSFYEAAYTSAVGSLIEEQPSRDDVSRVLRNELALMAEKECAVTFESLIENRTCYGHSQLSQLVALTTLNAKDLLLVSKAWAADRSVVSMKREITLHPVNSKQNAKMRVGFLSASFGDHPVGHHITPLLLNLNRFSFEVFCFFSPLQGRVEKDTSFREINRMACDEWIELEGEGEIKSSSYNQTTSTERSAIIISSLNIDVLIAIDGFDKGNRMDILSLRPAPCILSFFGYLATSGSIYIDGIIADDISIPIKDEVFYSEKFVLRHPVTFFVNNYWNLHPQVQINDKTIDRNRMSTTDDVFSVTDTSPFTFCSFSQLFKVTRETVNAWLSILNNTGDSTRLVLLGYPPTAMPNLEQYFQSKGFGHRVEFLPILPRNEHLLRKGQVCNLGLDTFYYNGHTTVADLLWAGVPVLTYADSKSVMAGKAAASLVKAAGAPRLFYDASSKEEYIQRAIDIARAYIQRAIDVTLAYDGKVGPDDIEEDFFWRPSKTSALFQTEKWVRGFEDVMREGKEQCKRRVND